MSNNQSNFVKRVNQVKSVVDFVLSWACIAIVAAMTILVTYQVASRYLFNSPSAVSEVLSRYLFIWLVFYGSAYVFGLREHMSITFVKDKLPEKLKVFVDMFIELTIVVFTYGVMVFGGYNTSMRQMWQQDSALQIPMGVIYSAIPISGVFILFYFFCNEVNLFARLKEINSKSK